MPETSTKVCLLIHDSNSLDPWILRGVKEVDKTQKRDFTAFLPSPILFLPQGISEIRNYITRTSENLV
jgi:hypothetical protein